MISWPDKDPDAVLDYMLDWTARLDGDRIVSSDWTVPEGLGGSRMSFTDTTTTIWLSDGDAPSLYRLTNRIATEAGRVFDASVRIRVRS